jgi:hypothetical protein
LVGPAAFTLMLVMVCAIVLAGGALLGLSRLVVVPAAGPRAISVTGAASTTPHPARPAVSALPAPSATPVPTAPGDGVVAIDALRVAAGDPAPITERGQQVGTVTILSAVYRSRIAGHDAPAGHRWLRVSMTVRASARMAYEMGRWSALDMAGRRHPWTGMSTSTASLGAGSLAASQSRTGYVVIAVSLRVAVVSLVLQGADGHDLLVVDLP